MNALIIFVLLFGLMLTPVFYVVLRTLAGGKIHVAGKDSAGYGVPSQRVPAAGVPASDA